MKSIDLNLNKVKDISLWKYENNQYTPDLLAIDMFMTLTSVNRLKTKTDYWNFAYRLQLLFPEKELKNQLFESNVVMPYYYNHIEHQLSINDLINIKGIEYNKFNTLTGVSNIHFEKAEKKIFNARIIQFNFNESNIHFVDSSKVMEKDDSPITEELKLKSIEYADFFVEQIPSTDLIKHELNDFFYTIFSEVTFPNDPKIIENIQEYFTYNLIVPQVEIIADTILIYLKEMDETNELYYNMRLNEINLKLEQGNIDSCLEELESLTDFEIPFHLDFLMKLEEVLRLYNDDYEDRLENVRHRILRLKPELCLAMIS